MSNIPIDTASVKVMRSYDYCHFEVTLSSNYPTGQQCEQGSNIVDELRKTAARLADKAVEQYKVAKLNAERLIGDSNHIESLRYRHRDILNKAETDRTPEEKAIIKALEDKAHHSRPRYDYDDQFEELPEFDKDFEDAMF